jgi:hypothetical protein
MPTYHSTGYLLLRQQHLFSTRTAFVVSVIFTDGLLSSTWLHPFSLAIDGWYVAKHTSSTRLEQLSSLVTGSSVGQNVGDLYPKFDQRR